MIFKLGLKSYFSYTMRHNCFGFLDMTGIDHGEIVFFPMTNDLEVIQRKQSHRDSITDKL